jgi:hypothetical protein
MQHFKTIESPIDAGWYNEMLRRCPNWFESMEHLC